MLFEIFEILKNPHKRKNLTMKKFVSLLLVLTMLVTVFAGLAVTASAADALLSVYTQAGEDGEKTLAKSYTAEELKKLTETKADG